MQITELTTHRKPDETRDANFLRNLQKRLLEVQHDYLFDKREAEARLRVERAKADAMFLQSKLRGDGTGVTNAASDVSLRRPLSEPQPVTANPADGTHDIFEDDDDSSAGLFEILQAIPSTDVVDGVTITVRDMGLPKHWSGRTPKILLAETVHKVDRFAAISYSAISPAGRAKRATVEIRWNGNRLNHWTMEDVACHDAAQAEQYIATVALHSLMFPSLDGFALGNNATATSFRLLPAVFRDLWDELEEARRLQDDSRNRSVWAKLSVILDSKMSPSGEPVSGHHD